MRSHIPFLARRGLGLFVLLVPALAVAAQPASSGQPQPLTQEKMDSIIASIRAASDAITIRCTGRKDTNFFTLSESLQGVYRTNTATNDADFFLENFAWIEDGHRFTSRVIFKDNDIVFGTLQDGEVFVEMDLDRTNLTMSQDVRLFGIPIHDGARCERSSSRKQF